MADNTEVYERIVNDWRAAVSAVRATGATVITLPVLDLQLILDVAHPGSQS